MVGNPAGWSPPVVILGSTSARWLPTLRSFQRMDADPYHPPEVALNDPGASRAPLRWVFIVLFSLSMLSQIVISLIAIRDGYFPSEEMLERFPGSASRYWIANRLVMPAFMVTSMLSAYVTISLVKRRWTPRIFWLGLVACLLTWIPFQNLFIVPVLAWIFTRRSYTQRFRGSAQFDSSEPSSN